MGLLDYIKVQPNKESTEATVSEKNDLQQLATKLNIPENLLTHHRFMVAFKSMVAGICKKSDDTELKKLILKDRIDLSMASNISLIESQIDKLANEFGNMQWFNEKEIEEWLQSTRVEPEEVKYQYSMRISDNSVDFQTISKSGTEVFRVPQIVSEDNYSVDDKGNLKIKSEYRNNQSSNKIITKSIVNPSNTELEKMQYTYNTSGELVESNNLLESPEVSKN